MSDQTWWTTLVQHPDTALPDLIDGFDQVTALAIPYARLPARARNNFAADFTVWSDLADQTLRSLIARPKCGEATVRALIGAARATVAAARARGSGSYREPATAAADLLGCLPGRDRVILTERVWSLQPATLEAMAARLGGTTDRVARHQRRAVALFAELCAEPDHCVVPEQAMQLRHLLGPITTSAHVDAAVSALGVQTDAAVTAMLLHLAGPYVDQGRWLVHDPGAAFAAAAAAIDQTLAGDVAPTTADFRRAIGEMGVPADIATELVASQPGLRRFGEHWVRWGTSRADKASAVLHLSIDRTPATLEMIVAAIGEDDDVGALRQALNADARVVRASQFTWALRAWGLPEYRGIFNEIAARIDAAGGSIRGADLISDMTACFPDVSEKSVITYIHHAPAFKTDHGRVRRRRASDPGPLIPPLNATRGAFRNGQNEIRLAVPVDREMLRGSGQAVPSAVAKELSVGPGCERSFTGPVDVIVRWRVSSVTGPSMSSLRPLAQRLAADLGDTIMVAFNLKTSSLQASRIAADDNVHHRLLALLGKPANDPITALARSLDCTTADVRSVLESRGDGDLASLLDNLTG